MVLCNNEMALPAIQQLYMSGSLKAVLVPQQNTELFAVLQQMLAGTPVEIKNVTKANLESTVKKAASEKTITAAWIMTFAYIIPKSMLNLFPGGFINFHYGLLPQFRGANPVLAQMINGETHNAITVHIVDENIDTGPIIMQQKIAIEDKDTFGIQLQKLGILAASMALNLLQLCRLCIIPPAVPQDESMAKYFNRPVAADLMVNWNTMDSLQIIRLINACNPWNKGAGSLINNTVFCLVDGEPVDEIFSAKTDPGTIIELSKEGGLKVYCLDNKIVRINVIYTPQGFLSGRKLLDVGLKTGDRFLSPKR